MTRLYANNFSTSLNGAITSGATSITVNNVTNFPAVGAGDTCILTIGGGGVVEIVEVSARSGFVLTVTRAQEGTTAIAWADGAPIELRATATSFSSGGGGITAPGATTNNAIATWSGTTGAALLDNTATLSGGVLTTAQDAVINTVTVGLGNNAISTNTAIGYQALSGSVLSGTNNIGIGYQAGKAITNAANVVAIGVGAGATITSSGYSVLIGTSAGGSGTTGNINRVAVGYQAVGGANTNGCQDIVALGYQAGKDSSGNYTVCIGSNAGQSNLGNLTTAVGYQALSDTNCSSTGAICVGYQAGIRVTSSYPIYIGVSSGGTSGASASGDYSIGIGYTALGAITSAANVVAVGGLAMTGVTTGGNNTGIGKGCGVTGPSGAVTLTTGTSNTMLGYRAGVDTLSTVGAISIGCDAVATKSTGATSGDDGPGIAIGSAGFPVGFQGDGSIYASSGASAGYWLVKINGTQYKIQLYAKT